MKESEIFYSPNGCSVKFIAAIKSLDKIGFPYGTRNLITCRKDSNLNNLDIS
jgi:hypothetical protein